MRCKRLFMPRNGKKFHQEQKKNNRIPLAKYAYPLCRMKHVSNQIKSREKNPFEVSCLVRMGYS